MTTAIDARVTLKDLIAPYLLRRMKCDVDVKLPEKTEQVLFCPMTAEQREAYRSYLASREVEEILDRDREALPAASTPCVKSSITRIYSSVARTPRTMITVRRSGAASYR